MGQWSTHSLSCFTRIPTGVFKTLPNFDVTIEKIAYEHYVDVANLCKIHNIQHEDVMVRPLA